ncbi:group II intron reverse transcriptase/maturase [Sporomusa termitida]|uniref:Group II intron reverse transcriptase/maturase n=2 Tax=Sporomusa termitida TaxID=2377 RepID=A0A517DR15_9FIRM|nr:group II intron reverse transcriptase/maturase [Sporomusa termitida]
MVRKAGTPQGGVISPVLANLFLHYAFDKWMARNNPQNPWARYADDGIIHCKTKEEAEKLLGKLDQRFRECGLELHPDKTKIIYCKDNKRTGNNQETTFDFLGYTFRPRSAQTREGERFLNFLPAVSRKASKAMHQTIRGWKLHRKTDKELADIAKVVNPVIRGWVNYYGRFYRSAMYPILRKLNQGLIRWVTKKYKRVNGRPKQAQNWLAKNSAV